MGKLFVAGSANRDGVEDGEPLADIHFGGVYFFLYPGIKSLNDQTGELIDPQRDAFFIASTLDDLELFVLEAKQRTKTQPEHWKQQVGVTSPEREPFYQTASRAEVLLLLNGIESAIAVARQTGKGVFFLGE